MAVLALREGVDVKGWSVVGAAGLVAPVVLVAVMVVLVLAVAMLA